jgi:uncharacterized membrane protein YhaH (DUF805 family)
MRRSPGDPAQQPGAYPPRPYPPQGGYLQGGRVGLGTAISQAFRHMFNYRGRASLSAFWWFYLFAGLAGGGIGVIAAPLIGPAQLIVLELVIFVALLLAVLPLTVRRLHDQNKSGFWIFIEFVPFIGVIWLLVLMVQQGTPGPNRFG